MMRNILFVVCSIKAAVFATDCQDGTTVQARISSEKVAFSENTKVLSQKESFSVSSDSRLSDGKKKRHCQNPDNLEFSLPRAFAGQDIPISVWYVRERIEQEFNFFLYDRAQSILTAKRMGRYFGRIERQLEEAGLPDDLKYIAITESQLSVDAVSPRGAVGLWQFMPKTGKRMRLKIKDGIDERRSPRASSAAAVKYLRALYDRFEGDWFLTLAAYNFGESNVSRVMREQQEKDYWKLHLPKETMRYVPRIIAAREIFDNFEKYLGLELRDLYEPRATKTVVVKINRRRKFADVAKEQGSSYLELKLLNPEFVGNDIPPGVYKIKVPVEGTISSDF